MSGRESSTDAGGWVAPDAAPSPTSDTAPSPPSDTTPSPTLGAVPSPTSDTTPSPTPGTTPRVAVPRPPVRQYPPRLRAPGTVPTPPMGASVNYRPYPMPPPSWDPRGPTSPPPWLAGASVDRLPKALAGSGRPSYREPMPVSGTRLVLGIVAGALWMALFGLQAVTAQRYAWWTVTAGALAWLTAVFLARQGDRGAAAGVAIAASVGVGIATVVVAVHWIGGNWLLW